MQDISKIAQIGWTKRWAAPLGLLGCSYWGRQYIQIAKRDLGAGFDHILFTHRKGITSCYRIRSETVKFGEYLVQKAVENPNILKIWSEKLKKQADLIRGLIAEPVASFLDKGKYKNFVEEFDKYYPFAGANNTIPDYLPPKLFEKYKDIIKNARMYSESVYNETEKFFKKLTGHIEQKEKYATGLLMSLFEDELAQYLDNNTLPDQKILEKRKNQSALFFGYEKRHTLFGEDIKTLEDIIAELSGLTTGKIKGNTACPGKAKGIARIIKDPKNVKVFNDGDILITGMTRPDFVPLMKKSGAIITDAGGVLCHAAIVSRELNKPCVIGTEIATRAFKDGDMIEVDAEKGIASKI